MTRTVTKIASRSLTRRSNGGTNSAGIGSDISRKVAVVTLIVTRRRDVTQLIDSQVMPSGVAWLATIDARRRDRKGFPARGAHSVASVTYYKEDRTRGQERKGIREHNNSTVIPDLATRKLSGATSTEASRRHERDSARADSHSCFPQRPLAILKSLALVAEASLPLVQTQQPKDNPTHPHLCQSSASWPHGVAANIASRLSEASA